MSEDDTRRWIEREMPAVRRELRGPHGLAVGVILQAYEDTIRPPSRDARLASGPGRPRTGAPVPPDPRAWLTGEGKALYRALGTRREGRAREQGERLG